MSDLKSEVLAIVDQLSADELRVFRYVGRRMIDIGHKKYGPLNLEGETRSWMTERAQERSDWVFYDGCIEIAREDAKRDRIARFKEAGLVEAEATFDVASGEVMEVLR